MNPQEMAAAGLKLIERAIEEYLGQHRDGVRQCDLATKLGLEQDSDEFTRVLLRSVAQKLVSEKRIRTEKRGRSRVYFPVE